MDPRLHRRPRRLADLRRRRTWPSCRPSGSRPSSAATTRWTATGAGSGRRRRSTRSRSERGIASHNVLEDVQRSYEAGITDEFLEPIVAAGAPRLGANDAAIFFNFRPDRGRQLAAKLVEAGFDLTTMTRYSAELDVPVVFGEQVVHEHARGGARRRRRAAAAHGRDREVRARHLLLQRRRRGRSGRGRRAGSSRARATCRATTSSRRCPRASSSRGFAAEIGNGYRFAVINFANPDMVGHTGSIPAVTRAVEVTDECLGVAVRGDARRRRRLPRDSGSRERRADAGGGRRQPAHRAHDESRSINPYI